MVKEVFAELLPVRENFGAGEIVKLLDSRPDLVAINAGVTETKYACGVIGLGAVGSLYERQPFAQTRGQTHAKAYLRYGKTRLAANTYVFIYDMEGNLLQTVKFHTSCSQPLFIGDQFGSLNMVGFRSESGTGPGM